MNLLEKLMSIINKQKQAILFSQKDKEIIREISQCNNSYYKTKVLDVLQCELSDWSYDISKYMIKDKNRLIAEKSISVIQEFKRLEDFLNLFEQYQKDEFINYELIEAIGYIGIMRQLDDDIIEKRMKEILQNLEKKGYAKYRIYDYLFYITKNEKYLDAILNGLQSWDDDIRYQALYTVEDVIINEDDNKWLKKINKKLSLCIALALMQSVYSTGAIASIPEGDSDNNSIAIGIGSSSAQESSIAIGKQASVEKTSKSAIAIGEDAKVIMGNNSNGAMNGNGAIAIGSGSTAAGYSSISVGYLAGKGSNGFFNFALGAEAGQNISGEENISVGRWANNNTTTSLNIAMGLNALRNSTDLVNAPIVISPYYASGGNLALGNSALMDIHGSSNVALGTRFL